MVSSAAKSVPQYLAELPQERRDVVTKVRKLILENLQPGYVESMQFGHALLRHSARPVSRHVQRPAARLRRPRGAEERVFALSAGRRTCSAKRAQNFRAAWAKSGKKLDMGKSCVRFKRFDDLALDVIASEIASISVDDFIRQYEKVRAETAGGARPAKAKGASKKVTAAKRVKPASRSRTKPADRRKAKAGARKSSSTRRK